MAITTSIYGTAARARASIISSLSTPGVTSLSSSLLMTTFWFWLENTFTLWNRYQRRRVITLCYYFVLISRILAVRWPAAAVYATCCLRNARTCDRIRFRVITNPEATRTCAAFFDLQTNISNTSVAIDNRQNVPDQCSANVRLTLSTEHLEGATSLLRVRFA